MVVRGVVIVDLVAFSESGDVADVLSAGLGGQALEVLSQGLEPRWGLA
jgi:hypothetical protein